MRCIHAKLNDDKTNYMSTLERIESNNDFLKFRCKLCGMEFTEEDVINLDSIWNPKHLLEYNCDFIFGGPISPFAPARKHVEKNLKSIGLLGPEINE